MASNSDRGVVYLEPGSVEVQKEQAAEHGNLSLPLGLSWAKSHTFHTGPTPVLTGS
jgi:hypothetical protein